MTGTKVLHIAMCDGSFPEGGQREGWINHFSEILLNIQWVFGAQYPSLVLYLECPPELI